MSKEAPLPIAFYKTPGGTEPVREWLISLPDEARKEVGADIRSIQNGGPWESRTLTDLVVACTRRERHMVANSTG
jgi:phage-related protein